MSQTAAASFAEEKYSEQNFSQTAKEARKSAGLTLDSLAERCGVSKSTLSRIENGHLSPTYDVICKLANGLGVSVESLFASPKEELFRGWRSLTRTGDRVTRQTPHYDLELLCSDIAQRKVLMFAAKITARSISEFSELVKHRGEEQLFVLDGQVEVHTEFYDPVVLGPGDSMAFDSRMGHAVVSIGPRDAEVLWVTDGHRPITADQTASE